MSDTQPQIDSTTDRPNVKMELVDSGEENGIRWATCKAPLYGAVNGYVQVPEEHPWHGLEYDDIDVDVHGGLTFSSDGWIGFDCLHFGDFWPSEREYGHSLSFHDTEWDADMVAEETRALARKVAASRVGASTRREE